MNNYRALFSSAVQHLDDVAERILVSTQSLLSPRVKRTLFILMALVFVSGLFYSIYRNPDLLSEANLLAFAAIAIVSFPAIVATSIVRYRLLALASGKNMTLRGSARVIVSGIAANMMPLPGSILIRAAGLTDNGKRFARATRFSIAATSIWLGVATTFSAAFAVYLGLILGGTIGLATGLLLIAAGMSTFPRDTVEGFPLLILSANALLMTFMTFQYWLAFAATGSTIGISQAAFLTICGPIGVVIAIAPAGMGVTELSAAALSTLVGIEPSRAFVALALSRIAQLVVTSALALILRHDRAE